MEEKDEVSKETNKVTDNERQNKKTKRLIEEREETKGIKTGSAKAFRKDWQEENDKK